MTASYSTLRTIIAGDTLRAEDWNQMAEDLEFLHDNIGRNPFGSVADGSLVRKTTTGFSGIALSGTGVVGGDGFISVGTIGTTSKVLYLDPSDRKIKFAPISQIGADATFTRRLAFIYAYRQT